MPEAPGVAWRLWLPLIAGWAILGLLIALNGPAEIFRRLREADPLSLAMAALAVLALAFIGALNLWLLFRAEARVPASRFLPVYWASWAIGLMVPGQAGDVASIALLLRRAGLDASRSAGISLVDKLISLAVLGTAGAVGLSLLRWSAGPWVGGLALFGLFAGIAVIAAAARLPDGRPGLLGRILGFVGRAARTILQFAAAHPGRLCVNLLFTVVKLLITGLAYQAAFEAVGQSPTLLQCLLFSSAAGLVAYVPVSINGVGTVEAVAIGLFGSIGIGAPGVIAAYALLRLTVLSTAWLPMLFLLPHLSRIPAVSPPVVRPSGGTGTQAG